MAVTKHSIKKKSVAKWKEVLAAVHGKLVQQMQVNDKLSPSKGRGGNGAGR